MGVKLVTGNGCTVGAEDDRILQAATISPGRVVFGSVGDMFEAEILSSNQIQINSGEGINQGAHFRIPYGDSEVVEIENGTQSLNRKDLIVARYEKNVETLEESVSFVVIKGTAVETAEDPEYNVGNLYAGDSIDDFPLYRVNIEGINIISVEPMFDILYSRKDVRPVAIDYDATNCSEILYRSTYNPTERKVEFRSRFTRKAEFNGETAYTKYVLGTVEEAYKPNIRQALSIAMDIANSNAVIGGCSIDSNGEISFRLLGSSNPTYIYVQGCWYL